MNAVLKNSISTGLALAGFVLVGGCTPPKVFDTSPGPISRPSQPAAPRAPPPAPVKAAPALAAPKPSAPVPTYTVVVNDVPVKDLLFSIARDTQYNIDLHPGIAGRVSLNAVQEPLPAILDRIARQADLRYEMNGRTVSIMPDTAYIKTYRVNYVNVSRNTASSIGVSSQISSTGSSANVVGGQSGASGNNSNTSVVGASKNEFWNELSENIRNILYSTKANDLKTQEKAFFENVERSRAYGAALAQSDPKFKSKFDDQTTDQIRASIPAVSTEAKGDTDKEVIVNPIAGTIAVFATQRQHETIGKYIDQVMTGALRQVLIEATIVEVNLKDQYRAGIDWSKALQGATGWSINTLGGGTSALASALTPFVQATYTKSGENSFTAAIDLLESFGKTKVLSSPKLMALNNQTAILKVVNNLVYFNVKADTTTNNNFARTSFTTTPQTVPIGIVMSVMPQINENGIVSLTVRPTITRQVGFVEDPNPELKKVNVSNRVPVIQVREMESLLQVRSGQTVILGGLIQDDSNNARDGIPGLSRPEGLGAVFGQHERINSQTELVIFLRPIVVSSPTLESDELRQFQRLLPGSTRSSP